MNIIKRLITNYKFYTFDRKYTLNDNWIGTNYWFMFEGALQLTKGTLTKQNYTVIELQNYYIKSEYPSIEDFIISLSSINSDVTELRTYRLSNWLTNSDIVGAIKLISETFLNIPDIGRNNSYLKRCIHSRVVTYLVLIKILERLYANQRR